MAGAPPGAAAIPGELPEGQHELAAVDGGVHGMTPPSPPAALNKMR